MKRKTFIIISVLIVVILISRSCCDSFSSHLTKKQIFRFVKRNEQLLRRVLAEVQSLPFDIISISTSEKAKIYERDYEHLQGLYICRTIDGKFVYENIDNDVFMQVMGLDCLNEILVRNDLLIFRCASRGFGSATAYYGFNYYINPILSESYHFSPEYTKRGKGWLWQENNGDNSLYCEKIADNFYYYEEYY